MKFRVFTTIAIASISAIAPSATLAQGKEGLAETATMRDLARFEPTGLSILEPFARGKIPVVFIHGLWSNPASWQRMVSVLNADPEIAGRYQLWTFGYSTGDPIPYSATLLRKNLDDARRKFDPDRSDAAFDRTVVVGHSMGGLLSKMLVTDAGDRLWRVVSTRPFEQLSGDKADIEIFREGLFFSARPEVRRVIYIATPHRGSHVDRGPFEQVGLRLVRVADPLQAAHRRLVSGNEPDFFREHFRRAIPSSIEELEYGSPILTGLCELPLSPAVKFHSIIAVRRALTIGEKTDGLVSYPSAHLEGALSEKVVMSGHLCQENPEVIGEVRRILVDHASR